MKGIKLDILKSPETLKSSSPWELFQTLSDPTRIKIIELLSETHELSAGNLAKKLKMSPASLSHHLKPMKEACWLISRRQHRSLFYRLAKPQIQEVVHAALRFLDTSTSSNYSHSSLKHFVKGTLHA